MPSTSSFPFSHRADSLCLQRLPLLNRLMGRMYIPGSIPRMTYVETVSINLSVNNINISMMFTEYPNTDSDIVHHRYLENFADVTQ